jgi:integrase
MGRRHKGELPRYRLHKQSGQAIVSLPLGGGKYRDILLGEHGSEESQREYTRVINEWIAAGMLAPPRMSGGLHDLTVAEVCHRFKKHAQNHYRLADGSPSRELEHYEYALKPLVASYGHTLAREFGPLKLKAVRQTMIDGGKLSRKVINQRVEHVKRVFRWAVSEELVPPSVHEGLKTLAGLRRGHQGTYERPKVKPVPNEHVEAILPFLSPQVAAMVQLQRFMGARPGEVCMMRGRHIDRSGTIWWYRIDPNEIPHEGPANLHKTAHHEGSDGMASIKRLPLGPQAQDVLKPWLREDPNEFLFQPREARQTWLAQKRAKRKSPLTPSQRARKPKDNPERVPKEFYPRYSYAHAIARACQRAGVPHWHPHQLKHSCGTEVRKRFGAEAARAFLGHTKLSTTGLYAEKDLEQVEKIAREIG